MLIILENCGEISFIQYLILPGESLTDPVDNISFWSFNCFNCCKYMFFI